MHRTHARHEARSLETSFFEDIPCIFAMADRRSPSRAHYEIFVPVKPAYVLDRDPQRVRGHGSQIVGCQPLPSGPRREIEGSFVDETGRFEADPGPPIQLHPCAKQGNFSPIVQSPCAFVQGMTGSISREDAPSIRTIKDQMARRLPDHSSTGRFEIFFERQVFGKREMTWCRKGRKNGIGGHLEVVRKKAAEV